jgi:UPF0716 protein FxsA
MVKWIIIAILALPVLEIAVFMLVAAVIGFGWAVLLMLATTVAGFAVLRRAGRKRLAQFRMVVTDSNMTELEAHTGGILTVLAGVLLVLPGFLTDLAGAALLIGPARNWFAATVRRALHGTPGRHATIDLAPGEWRRISDQEIKDQNHRRRGRRRAR